MPQELTEEHKAALAEGRRQSRAVRSYLDALETDQRSRGRLDEEDLKQRIAQLESQAEAEDNPAKRVELIQKRLDYERRLDAMEDAPDMDALRQDFVGVARDYSARKGISYAAWREAGVPAAVLREAGIPRTDRPPKEG